MKKLLLFFVFALTAVSMMAQNEVICAADNVCLRTCPSESCKWGGHGAPHFDVGDTLPWVGTSGNYYKVEFNGYYYYVPKKYFRKRGTPCPSYVVIAGDDVCVRSCPSESCKKSYPRLYTGEEYRCVGESGKYYQIDYDDRYYYVPKKYCRAR